MLKLLIVDNHNSIRSQILEAYLAKALNKRAQVISAGKEATGIDPQAIRIMAEDGYVIAGQTSKSLKEVEAYPYNAILFCARNGVETVNCTLYVTVSPCIQCSLLIATAGIVRVVYVEKFRETSGIEFLHQRNIDVCQLQQL